jgi:hypothetical protein
LADYDGQRFSPLARIKELRQALGTAVFFGMLGVTLFGLLFTPVFYVLVRSIGTRRMFGGQKSAPRP